MCFGGRLTGHADGLDVSVLRRDGVKKRTPWLFLSNWVSFTDVWMTSSGGCDEKLLWGRNQELHFRYFQLDMSLKTAKCMWQEGSWIDRSEGQGWA